MGTRDTKDYWVQRPLSEQARKFHLWEGGTLYGMASGVVGSGEAIFFDFGAAGTVVSGDTSGNLYSNLKTAHSGINATYPSRLLIGAGTDVWELGNKFFGSGSPTYSGIYPTYASDVDMLRASRSGWNGVDWEYTVVFLKGSGINQSIFAPLGGPGSKTKGLYTHFSNGPASRAIVDGIPTETTDQEGEEQTRYGLDNFDIFDKYIHYYEERGGSKNTINNWNEKAVTRNFKWIFEPSQKFNVYNDKREIWDSGAAKIETELPGCSGCYEQYGGVWPNHNMLRCLPFYNAQACVQAGGYWNPPDIKDTPPISDPPESPPSDDEETDTTDDTTDDTTGDTSGTGETAEPSPAGEKENCPTVGAKWDGLETGDKLTITERGYQSLVIRFKGYSKQSAANYDADDGVVIGINSQQHAGKLSLNVDEFTWNSQDGEYPHEVKVWLNVPYLGVVAGPFEIGMTSFVLCSDNVLRIRRTTLSANVDIFD